MNIYAHRGFSGKYPENTILAFKKCLDMDIYGIELDVHRTKDGKIVVIHDEKVDRTFNGHGFVKDFTLRKLKTLNSSFEGYQSNKECKIPTLEEVLILISPTDLILNIELKTDKINYPNIEKDVLELILKYNMKNRVLISSFNSNSLKNFHKLDPSVKTGLLCYLPINNVVNFAKFLGNSYLHPPLVLVNESLIELCHKNLLGVNAYTVNEEDDILHCLKLNVDGIFTNYPDIASNLLHSKQYS
ncbi:TPA: glycerophosphodiester phosphodiesterase [Clostridioides difficile]|uniref:glycerophosphodiester phosphodiesterase n=1 Tax=Clostridioides difficile TaxID=1496 RepID=UPI000E56D0D1|nr:glycerophosphodiester phosphodiesterase [Clostridioides difficile]AXU71357.1 glycerophosphoryl diester phosphodiesterase [Clostridioides difficile]HBE9570748.1 glycerophosphodiester phosphodiesterase [Clostridioides difficile]HBG4017256.1 glycerophosphodiester phosphodiesterase [Clostridioides difficile]